jgi:mRNA interferase RelE/StbE
LAWQIELAGAASKQLARLDPMAARRFLRFLRERIEPADDPRQWGKALKDQASPLWRYRVGNYRLVCELKDDVMVVLVVRVGHRREVYR